MLRSLLAHPQHLGKPGVGKFERKAGNHQNDKAGKQNQMLPALVGVMRTIMGFCIARRATALLRQIIALCRNMAPITTKISDQIEPADPAHRDRSDILVMESVAPDAPWSA